MKEGLDFGKHLCGEPERKAVLAACAGAIISVLVMAWSNGVGTVLGYMTLLPYSAYRIAQLVRRPECRQDRVRMLLIICIATVTLLNAFGFGRQMKFLLVLFGVEAWLYFRGVPQNQ